MIQNEYVYAILCRPEVAGDVVSGGNVKTIEGYAVLNFEVASISSFRDIKKKLFRIIKEKRSDWRQHTRT